MPESIEEVPACDAPQVTLTREQQTACDHILQWHNSGSPQFALGGYAGTGKTTLMDHIQSIIGGHIQFLAPTGKAAHVLRSKGVETAETIHSYIYNYLGKTRVRDDANNLTGKNILHFSNKEDLDVRPTLIAVDEASMVNNTLHQDLMALGVPILWVGDHGQLPPVGGDPGLMQNLDARLETIHRQALDNPILRIAHHVREGNTPIQFVDKETEIEDARLRVVARSNERRVVEYAIKNYIGQIICAFNRTRHAINAEFRKQVGHEGELVVGDKLICLNNNRRHYLFNGMIFYVTKILREDEDFIYVDLKSEDNSERRDIGIFRPTLANKLVEKELDIASNCSEFNFGYAVTAHKSQGSEWDRVLVLDQVCRNWSMSRWRYTAYTRAKQHLTVSLY